MVVGARDVLGRGGDKLEDTDAREFALNPVSALGPVGGLRPFPASAFESRMAGFPFGPEGAYGVRDAPAY